MSDKLSNKHQDSSSAMQGSNTLYLETLYRKYQKDNNAVHSSWKSFFDSSLAINLNLNEDIQKYTSFTMQNDCTFFKLRQ